MYYWILGHKVESLIYQLHYGNLRSSNRCWCMEGICIFLGVLEKSEPGIFCDLKRPSWGPGADQIPSVSSLRVSWWKTGTCVSRFDSKDPRNRQWTWKPSHLATACPCLLSVLHTDDHPGCEFRDGPAFCMHGQGRWGFCKLTWSRVRSTAFSTGLCFC